MQSQGYELDEIRTENFTVTEDQYSFVMFAQPNYQKTGTLSYVRTVVTHIYSKEV